MTMLWTESRICEIVQTVGAWGAGVIPMIKVFSGRNLIERGRFKQYRMIAPHDTTLPSC